MRKLLILLLFLVLGISLAAEWSVIATYEIPEGASGLAYDGEYLYCGIYGSNGDKIYQLNPADGSYTEYLSGMQEDCYGLTFDGEYLWTTDHPGSSSNPATALKLDSDGNIVEQFDLPDHYMSGIAYDEGNFWVSSYYDPEGYIYQVDHEGTILQEFDAPDEQPWDLCMENDYLWMADYWGDALYKIDPTDGSMLESHASESTNPAGIVYDGQYLWYCDNGFEGVDYLYKVDLEGGGTPAIDTNFTSYDFTNVQIDTMDETEITVYNNGDGDLEISEMDIPSSAFTIYYELPIVISPSDAASFVIEFLPTTYGAYNSALAITSNDPLNPVWEVELSGFGVYENQEIAVDQQDLSFGSVRKGSSTALNLEIVNQGLNCLEISDIETTDDNYYFIAELPATLEVNEVLLVTVWFNPYVAGNIEAELQITSNDSDENPLIVELNGTATDETYSIGEELWHYTVTGGYDNSLKALAYIQDITGDDKEEVIACSEDNYVRCINGNASNEAEVIWETEISNVYHQNNLYIAPDLNDDGCKDVLVGTAGKKVYVLSGKEGNIIWIFDTTVYGEGGWIYQTFAKYDYNEDGTIDVLAASGDDAYDTGPQRIFCLDGTNGEEIWNYFYAGPKFAVIGVEDFTGDGFPDVVGGASNAYETEGKVFGINGADGGVEWTYNTSGSSVWALASVADINDDGIKDIVAGDFAGAVYGIDPTTGDEIWANGLGSMIILRFEDVGDANGNGYSDLAVAHSSSSNALLIDSYDGSIVWTHQVADQPWCVDVANDLNGDGVKDLVVGTLFQNNRTYFLDGSNGNELGSNNFSSAVDAICALPDVTDDGSWEMVAGGRDGTIICYSGGLGSSANHPNTISPNNMLPVQNYPNPFNPTTNIEFTLPTAQQVQLTVYNLKGQKIRTLVDEIYPAGKNTVVWNGKDKAGQEVSSGVYFYKLETAHANITKKMLLMK